MRNPPPQERHAAVLSTRLLLRDAVRAYLRFLPVSAAVMTVRLVPFYVLFWFLSPGTDATHAVMETAVAVPCVAALVRIVWNGSDEAHPRFADSLLGASPVATLKLLVTNLFLLTVALMVAQYSPQWFLGFIIVWTWAALVTDQVVLIEGKMMITAIARSYSIVRRAWKPSLLGLVAVLLPEALNLTITEFVPEALKKELLTRGVTLLFLPFSTAVLTLLYERTESLAAPPVDR
ncbi:MAG: hypothetical protein BWY20_01289 [Spirochaetes bacterium ADurb.Bin215]|nr:MAG: hypothetical protein BWY20_01289 [Spirochaetes bacterium ADurb.Bin215]